LWLILYSLEFDSRRIFGLAFWIKIQNASLFILLLKNAVLKFRKLGRTKLLVSEIGFGAWAISGHGYGPTDDKESVRAIHKALDLGVNIIDTADSYGNGHGEALIGRVLRDRGDRHTIIATKFGWDFYSKAGIRGNLKREYISFAVEQSLKRLQRDWIDIYQIHNSKPQSILREDAYESLDILKKQGKIRFYGVSSNHIRDGIEAISTGKPDVIQVRYNILDQEAEKCLLPLAFKNDIGIIAREPLSCGLLTGKYRADSKFPKTDHRRGWDVSYLEESVKRVRKLVYLENNERSLTQSAIRFALSGEAVSTVIPGGKTTDQVGENIAASTVDLSHEELVSIRKLFNNNFE